MIMKKVILLILVGWLAVAQAFAQKEWKIVPGKITTEWAAKVNASSPHAEYPRPQLTRNNNWKNLNGLWRYTILPDAADAQIPESFDGDILVPFAVESALSGVGRAVGKDSVLWYYREIEIPSSLRKGKVLLHFGAVDWAAQVYVNGTKVGTHEGGYDPFSFDISSALNKGTKQKIAVRVWDPTDEGPQPAGKQVNKPESIWYTPVTGIWQTVWVEAVPETYILSTRQTPDIDESQLQLRVETSNLRTGDQIKVTALDGSVKVTEQLLTDGETTLSIPNAKLWSPENPFLYDLKITILRKGKIIDEVGSYFGMRKISMAKDQNGIQRMMLNNEFVFQYGPLDQGWWPDGLYTAPTDEALVFDILKTREMGFNMIRKHIKVEPARWYYHCDKLGMLVWQDMPSGDRGDNNWSQHLRVKMPAGEKVDADHDLIAQAPDLKFDKVRSAESERIFRKEWKAIMDKFHNYPSIVVWVPFNEAWGQFKTKDIVEWTMKYDTSRLVNAASGGNFFVGLSPILDLHYYTGPAMPDPAVYGSKQILVLGEFGGLGLPVKDHVWLDKGNWGYKSYDDKEKLLVEYAKLIGRLPELIRAGLSAAVYTQTTDVEIETNGLMTYDRKVIKIPVDELKKIHSKLYNK